MKPTLNNRPSAVSYAEAHSSGRARLADTRKDPTHMDAGCVLFNGVDATSGDYLCPTLGFDEVAPRLAEHLRKAAPRWREIAAGNDPRELQRAGWGVLFGSKVDQTIIAELAPLLRLRRSQAGSRYREFRVGSKETARSFLKRHGSGPGPVDPRSLPYYFLLVADPDEVSFRFQYRLDVQHAVGRLWFDDPQDFGRYAQTVVALESDPPKRGSHSAVFFGPWRDEATRLSAEGLVRPLAQSLTDTDGRWHIGKVVGDQASKRRLAQHLGGFDTPDLLFTAGHGLGFGKDDPRQMELQGALVCQDWPGPGSGGPLPDFCFGAHDLADDASVRGLISFHFACYSAGTPEWDSFATILGSRARKTAPRAFVARLAQRLLAHPGGSALAVIGHVDQAWQHSFAWDGRGPNVETFRSALHRLLEGYPVGAAMEYFGQRYGEIAIELAADLEDLPAAESPVDRDVARLWLAHHDARNYIVLGDPAARLAGI